MRVSDYILARLAEEGITHAFTVYGGAISELMDAFTRQDRMRYVTCIHEQAAGFAAEGYAKARGVPGLAIATSGPGGGNLVTAIQDCYYDSTPCVFITGQVASKFINRSPMVRQLGFQETPICDIVRPITKYCAQPLTARETVDALEVAIHACSDGRPGPVLLDIPGDVQRLEVDGTHRVSTRKDTGYQGDAFKWFVADLRISQRPAILVGGGARAAASQIEAFATAHAIPVFRTWNALDIITDDMPCYAGTIGTYGGPGRNYGIQTCDLLLALGCRLSGRITGGMPETFARGAKKYIVDVDQDGLAHQQVRGDVNVCARVEDFMADADTSVRPAFDGWLAQCREWVTRYDPVQPQMREGELHHYGFMRRLSELAPANAIIVYDTGGNAIMMGHCWQSKREQRIFSSNGNTPMGFAMCGAIGAWFVDPTRPVICIIGDGGMQMNIQELQTIVNHGVKLKVFILNNKVLGNTLSYQRVNGMREVGCRSPDYTTPDFVKIMVAYGVDTFVIESPEYVDLVIAGMLQTDEACVCDVIDPDRCTYEPRVSKWDVGIECAYPPLPQAEHDANMFVNQLEDAA